jgi:hypothetical protein
VREVRPRYLRRRTYQRTLYRPGELLQFDLFEPWEPIPVGHGQTPRGFVVTAELSWSRALAGALVFSKQFPDLAYGMRRCLKRLGALPDRLVWDREGAIHAGGGRPSGEFAPFSGQLAVGWVIFDSGDAETKGLLERSHRFMRSSFEPGRGFTHQLDYQAQLDAWTERANARTHRTTRAVPAERLREERGGCEPCRSGCPRRTAASSGGCPSSPTRDGTQTTTRSTPRLAGRRVEVRISQHELLAVALDSGELACRHRRSFAKHVTVTEPAHLARGGEPARRATSGAGGRAATAFPLGPCPLEARRLPGSSVCRRARCGTAESAFVLWRCYQLRPAVTSARR